MRIDSVHGRAAGLNRPFSAPGVLVVAGAMCLSASAMFVKLADVNSGTAAFLRCAIALVALVPLAWRECRRRGRMRAGLVGYAVAAGVFLGVDYVMWAASVLQVGAGIATVLVNVQVIAFPVLARVFSGTAMARRFLITCPIMLVGVALASGALGHSAQAHNIVWGSLLGMSAGVAYAGYLYLNRLSGQRSPVHVATPVCVATAAAAVTAGIISMFTTGIDLTLPPRSWAWMATLAMLGQVVAWLLLSRSTPKLPPNTAATLLLLQPVMAIVFGMLILRETPTGSQLAGCAVVITAVWFANTTRRRPVGRDLVGQVP